MTDSPFSAVVLAGERPSGSPLARQLNIPAGVLANVAGRAAVLRVLDALQASGIQQVVLCGPNPEALATCPDLQKLIAERSISWCAPASGPAASALLGMETIDCWPALLTSGDHALLNAAIIDEFCTRARALDADAVVGLVPWRLVHEAFPGSRRTLLKFADETSCGSNLFAVLNRRGLRAIEFWQQVEALRKRPWKIARRLGWGALLKYLGGRFSRDAGVAALSVRAGCRVRWVSVQSPEAAVDIDTLADLELANDFLGGG